MPPDEGLALYEAGLGRPGGGAPMLEIGSYCGKSAIYLGARRRRARHRAVRARPPPGLRGEPAGMGVARAGPRRPRRSARMDTLPLFRRTVHDAGLEASVVALVGDSPTVGRHWRTPLGAAVHRRRPRHRAGAPRLRDVDAVGRARRPARASTTSSRTRPTAAARRTRSTAAPSSRRRSRTSEPGLAPAPAPPLRQRARRRSELAQSSVGSTTRRRSSAPAARRGRRTAPRPGWCRRSASAASTIEAAV